MEKPLYLGHRARIKNKFKTQGLKPFLDHEVLELLLTYSIPRHDTKKLAWSVLKQFDSFSGVFNAGNGELQKIKGLGPQSAMLICLVKEIIKRYCNSQDEKKINISNQTELFDYCIGHLTDSTEESIKVMLLDTKLNLITIELLEDNSKEEIIKNIMKFISIHGAKYVIYIKTKKTEEAVAEKSDNKMRESIAIAAESLCANLADFIIIGTKNIYSLFSNITFPIKKKTKE